MVRDVRLLIAIEQYSKAVFEIIWKCMVLAILLYVIVPKEPRQISTDQIQNQNLSRLGHPFLNRASCCLFVLTLSSH